jgi:tRNA threonylcarbamoyladenosine biosynthesis protein TsaE
MTEMTYQQNKIQEVAQKIINIASCKTLCFYGPMGAGKTTLIKEMVRQLNGASEANSPTFGIVNEYHTKSGSILGYHFDFYRLEDETEVLDLGFEDYLNQDVWIFMEWPEKIKSFLPKDVFNIQIELEDPTTRRITF